MRGLLVMLMLGAVMLSGVGAVCETKTTTVHTENVLTASGDFTGAFTPNFGDCVSMDGSFGSTKVEIFINGSQVMLQAGAKSYSGAGVTVANKTAKFDATLKPATGSGGVTLKGTVNCGALQGS
jgi:hypothetical protein